jgi:hypothetical protein
MSGKYNSLGAGWNTFEQSKRNEVLNLEIRELNPNTDTAIHICNSSEEVNQKLEVSGSLGVEATTASFEAKASFAKELTRKSNAITILICSKHTFSGEVKTAKFKETFTDIKDLLAQGGDSYISYVETGAEYYAAYQFIAQSSEQRSKISAEAEASFGKGARVKASLKAQLENVESKTSSVYTFKQRSVGYSGSLPDVDDIAKFALEFPGKDISNPALLKFETQSYSTIKGCPAKFAEKIDPWIYGYKKPEWYAFSLLSMDRQAQVIMARVQAVKHLYAFYGADWVDPKLAQNIGKLEEVRTTINKWRRKFDQGKTTVEKPQLDVSCFEVPSPHFELEVGYFKGRDGGGWFKDLDREMIYSYVYPKTWRCKGGTAIDSMTTVYGCRNPTEPSNERMERTFEKSHGGDGGGTISESASFSPNEIWWTGVWLDQGGDSRWQNCVSGFEVKRRPEQEKNYQWGRNSYSFEGSFVPDAASFIGFQGRAGSAIDALQPVYVQFQKAYWNPVHPDGK